MNCFFLSPEEPKVPWWDPARVTLERLMEEKLQLRCDLLWFRRTMSPPQEAHIHRTLNGRSAFPYQADNGRKRVRGFCARFFLLLPLLPGCSAYSKCFCDLSGVMKYWLDIKLVSLNDLSSLQYFLSSWKLSTGCCSLPQAIFSVTVDTSNSTAFKYSWYKPLIIILSSHRGWLFY